MARERKTPATTPTIDAKDVARFSAVAADWWNPRGPIGALHALNPVRLAYIREQALDRFDRDGANRQPFAGLRLIDVGCGGGLVCEPMARLGFTVTGIDASKETIGVARAHASASGLTIDYAPAAIEDIIAKSSKPFDVLLALEVAEHVADPKAFLRQCASLLAPGGLMILATLNRTLKALVLGKLAAEYLLRWVPAGTHDWRKFLPPGEVAAMLEDEGLAVEDPIGVSLDFLGGRWRRSTDTAVNYMMAAHRARAVSPARGLRAAS